MIRTMTTSISGVTLILPVGWCWWRGRKRMGRRGVAWGLARGADFAGALAAVGLAVLEGLGDGGAAGGRDGGLGGDVGGEELDDFAGDDDAAGAEAVDDAAVEAVGEQAGD